MLPFGITWDKLRWEFKTSQLIKLAGMLRVNIEDIPMNSQCKGKIAKRIYEKIKK